MEDSADTIIISGIGENVEGKDFVEFIKTPGPVKIGSKTGMQMAMMTTITGATGNPTRVGIVTYETPKKAENAVIDLQALRFKDRRVNVQQAEDFFEQDHVKTTTEKGLLRDPRAQDYNTAWIRLMQLQLLTRKEGKGGAGGKGGKVIPGFLSYIGLGPRVYHGHDGEPGQDASEGGKGGMGGKPAIG